MLDRAAERNEESCALCAALTEIIPISYPYYIRTRAQGFPQKIARLVVTVHALDCDGRRRDDIANACKKIGGARCSPLSHQNVLLDGLYHGCKRYATNRRQMGAATCRAKSKTWTENEVRGRTDNEHFASDSDAESRGEAAQ